MSTIPSPRPPFDNDPPSCLPGCTVDHRPGSPEDGSDGAWYCRTAGAAVWCGTDFRGRFDSVEVATDRCLVAATEDASTATPWRVTMSVPSTSITSFTPEGARTLAFALLARADAVDRSN